MRRLFLLLLCLCFVPTIAGYSQLDPLSPKIPSVLESTLNSPDPFEQQEFLNMHQQLRILGLLTLLGLIPFIVMMTTSFTRITIIFHFLRQALGTQQVPSNQLVVGLSLILTAFVMHPVIEDIQDNALTPYLNNEFADTPEVRMGIKGEDTILMEKTWGPMRHWMLNHTREKDMELFLDMGHITIPKLSEAKDGGTGAAYDLAAIPWFCVIPAFVMTELRIGFMMGFLLFMPFLVIDMIVASILMSMGMMMLPPVMVSMPFKLLLFIVIDGWKLIVQQIVVGFNLTI